MELIKFLIDYVLHIDKSLETIFASLGLWTYLALFVVIFVETGLVIMPFLPGDSLLFAAGVLAARAGTGLNIMALFALLGLAAVLGDTANYWIGHKIGDKAFNSNSRWLKREYLERTQAFYNKHGGKTIFLARFVPIVRTFAPFVAGVGRMRYSYFITYNIVGGIVWSALFLFLGYFFGGLPIVQDNFPLVIIAIVIISVLPAVFEYLKERNNKPQAVAGVDQPAP